VAAKVIVELQAIPGRRAELKSLIESIVAEHGPRSWTYGVSVTRGCEPRIPGLVGDGAVLDRALQDWLEARRANEAAGAPLDLVSKTANW